MGYQRNIGNRKTSGNAILAFRGKQLEKKVQPAQAIQPSEQHAEPAIRLELLKLEPLGKPPQERGWARNRGKSNVQTRLDALKQHDSRDERTIRQGERHFLVRGGRIVAVGIERDFLITLGDKTKAIVSRPIARRGDSPSIRFDY
jgi:hypothetical protein